MSARTLLRGLGVYGAVLVVLSVAVRSWFSLSAPRAEVVVVSVWKDGRRVGRRVLADGERLPGAASADVVASAGASRVEELVVGEAPLSIHPLFFTMGLVPGRDGVKAEIDGKLAYATVDDLLSIQAYEQAYAWAEAGFGWGTHRESVLYVLSEQLDVPTRELALRAKFSRVRFERRGPASKPYVSEGRAREALPESPATGDARRERGGPAWGEPPTSDEEAVTDRTLTREAVLTGVREAAAHLARNVDENGRFRYMIVAPTNVTMAAYNWPRHAGTTFFLAQAASLLDDPFVRHAALRAAALLRDERMRACGENVCVVGGEGLVEIGSSALGLIAFTEIVRTGADFAYRPAIERLAAFLRSQQRSDGEFMHLYDRAAKAPLDVQFLYFSGEVTLALARAHRVTGDPRDLDAARRGLSRITGSGWSFFGSRYYYSEEHWTCQAVAELWDRAPDHEALAFCARWHEFQRRLQQDADETPFDADGAFGFGPVVSPRLTPAASRGEAAGALLDVLVRERLAGRTRWNAELPLVDRELRRAIAFVLRNQFLPGPTHLFADPVAIRGAVPASPVDWNLRIDYAQHAGSMMVRWLEVEDLERQGRN